MLLVRAPFSLLIDTLSCMFWLPFEVFITLANDKIVVVAQTEQALFTAGFYYAMQV